MQDKSSDFDGLLELSPELPEQLHQFLHTKEIELADKIINAFLPGPLPAIPSIPLPETHTPNFRLPEMVAPLENAIRSRFLSLNIYETQSNWNDLRGRLNKALWEYVELLEDCSAELYEELSHISFDQWRAEIFETVKKVNDELLQRVEDARTVIDRLEHLLWEYRVLKQSPRSIGAIIDRVHLWFTMALDDKLKANLDKTEKFLRASFKDCDNRFESFRKLDPQVTAKIEKFGQYQILRTLDKDNQDKIGLLTILLQCWESARKSYTNILPDVKQAIYHAVNINHVPHLFQEYYLAMLQSLFTVSRSIKGWDLNMMMPLLNDTIKTLKEEVEGLATTVLSYRNFISPNLPKQAEDLSKLNHNLHGLDKQFIRLQESLEYSKDPEQKPYHESLKKEIEGILHSTGQPLISRQMMRSKVHQLLPLLRDLNELGSPDKTVSDFVQMALIKALKADWKTQTLQEFQTFHELVFHHLGISGQIDDRAHINRFGKFKRIINHIEHWVKEGKTYRHIDEIEVDMNDIKEILQDYLATVQRFVKESVTGDKEQLNERYRLLSQMLLEYRYLFGNFYFFLRKHNSEGEYTRNKFHYIERYFDAVELQLNNFSHNLIG